MLDVVIHDDVFVDLQGFEFEVQVAFKEVVQKIAEAPSKYMNRLIEHREVGDLSMCFKAYVDPDPNRFPAMPARYRVVFLLLPDSKSPEHLQVIAFGTRDGLDVYRRAAGRIGEN